MMKKNFIVIFAVVIAAILITCNEPVFYMVSKEAPKVEPLIEGSPTNFVIFDNAVYVASGEKIFSTEGKVEGEGKDRKVIFSIYSPPDFGRVIYLASTTDYLYAVCLTDDSANKKTKGILKRSKKPSSGWDTIYDADNVQSVFAAGKDIFICTMYYGSDNKEKFKILHSEESLSLSSNDFLPIKDGLSTELRGVIGIDDPTNPTKFLLCAGSLYNVVNNSGTIVINLFGVEKTKADDYFMGIVNINSTIGIAAVDRSGKLFRINNNSGILTAPEERFGSYSTNQKATGSIATCIIGSTNFLLIGRQDMSYSTSSGYTHGYLEIVYDNNDFISDRKEPGKDAPTTTDSYDAYISSIGKNPVNHIIQIPSSIDVEQNKIILASSQSTGVWRLLDKPNDDDVWERSWNQQEK